MTYRGYTVRAQAIHPQPSAHTLAKQQWLIYKEGKFVCQQPSKEFACKWIDEQVEG